MSTQFKNSFKSIALATLMFGFGTQLSAQFADRSQTLALADKAEMSFEGNSNISFDVTQDFFDMDEFLPEDHRSDVIIYRDARYVGGKKAMKEFMLDNFNYPEVARENGLEGRMMAEFTIGRDGSIQDIKVVKSVHESLDQELVRVLNDMPNWNPAIKYGFPATSKVLLPFKASLK